jgi:large subunit ribosomal protein L24
MAHIRKGDEVVAIAGKNLGQRGKVLLVDPKKGRVKVEKLNIIKKHVKPNQKHPQGGIIEKEGWIAISNVMLWDPKAQAACRVGIQQLEDGRKVRVSKKSGEVLD